MDYWYKNTVAVVTILLAGIFLEYLKTNKIKAMFQANDIEKDLQSIGSVLLIIAHPDDEIMFWTPTIKTLISKNSQFDNNSLISEIKSNEKFELKDVNVKENEEKANIEDTKEKLSDKSFLNEKEFKLNELLELISMNKKNRDNKSENNEIKDEAENYELNNQNNSSKLNQNSSSNKKRVKLTITDKDKDPGSGTSRNSLIKHN